MKLEPNKYAELVKSGKIVAPKTIHQAIARHEADLKRSDIYFDHEAGARVLQIVSIQKHTKGKWAGQRFEPLLWQQWLIYVAFGWKRNDGSRRFRTMYIEVPRKNGKSALMATLGNYMFYADNEDGPEIYTGATTTKQAKIVFNESRAMVLNNPALKSITNVYQHHMTLRNDPVGKFEPTSREADNMDGLNPSCAIIDEYHAHKTSAIYDVFKSAIGARRQPMLMVITTAGFNKGAPCFQLRKTCLDILSGKKKDDSFFTMIYAPDDDDDWTLQKTWKKCNPSIGATILMQYLKDEFTQAKNNVGEQVNFKTKHLDMWTETSTTWIESSKWDAAVNKGINDSHLANWECYAGLDLASTRDITALVLAFINGEKIFVKSIFFVPEDTIMIRSKADGVAYDTWKRQGHLIATPGNVTDQNFVQQHIMELAEKYRIKSIAYDRWNSTMLVTNLLAEGANMQPFAQSYAHMNVPTKTIDSKLYGGQLQHDGNPVMGWMIGNVELSHDSSGNIKPDKAKSSEKIDGVVALAMAIGEWMTDQAQPEEPSVYETRGFLEI